MEEKQGYDVLRIVVHSDRCYMSTDYVRGKQLIVWLKYHSRIDKEMLFEWIRELIENLEHFHQCRGNPCYQYVNPYSIIVGENKKLYLLDLGSKEQDEMLHLMQRRYVRENFLSPGNQYYQKASVQEDIYGFGKTVQYLLSAAEVEPSLGKFEELRLKNVISRCINRDSKKCYQSIQEISEHFPTNRKSNNCKMLTMRKVLVCAAILIGLSVTVTQAAGSKLWNQGEREGEKLSGDVSGAENNNSKILEDYREEMRQKQEQWDISRQEIEEEHAQRERELVHELAIVYFIELEEYHKSLEIMEDVETPDAFDEDFIKLCAFMDGQVSSAEEDMEQLIERLKREVPNPEDERYTYCISKGSEKLKGMLQESEEGVQDTGIQDVEVQNTEIQDVEASNTEVQGGASDHVSETGDKETAEQ